MWIKPVIIISLIALIISLVSGFVFLLKDVGGTKRTMYSLGVRVSLAVALIAVTAYGFFSGQLRVGAGAPWDARKYSPPPSEQAAEQQVAGQRLDNVNEQEQADPDNVNKVPVP